MAKKTTRKKKTAGAARGSRRRGAGKPRADLLSSTWHSALEALGNAEVEVQKQIRALMKSKRISGKDASRTLQQIGNRIERERKRAVKDLDGRVKRLQTQVRKERKALDRRIDGAVQGALSAFNLPSRREVTELTRKVNQLSKKIDSLPRSGSRKATRRRSPRGARQSA